MCKYVRKNFLRFVDAELGLGHSPYQVIAGSVDSLLQIDPLLYLRGLINGSSASDARRESFSFLVMFCSLPRQMPLLMPGSTHRKLPDARLD